MAFRVKYVSDENKVDSTTTITLICKDLNADTYEKDQNLIKFYQKGQLIDVFSKEGVSSITVLLGKQ